MQDYMLIIDNLFQNEAFKVFLLSMLPITELRFSIPYGINFYSIPTFQIVLISIVGNIFIGILIVYIIGPTMYYFKKIPIFNSLINYIFNRTLNKSKSIEKRKFYGLLLFVSIPLPMTGVWTGALASYLLNLNRYYSILAISFGVMLSATIVTTLTLFSIDLI